MDESLLDAGRILPDKILGRPGLIAPNSLLRSALFSAAGGKRELLQRVKVASLSNIEITYTGARLGQTDLDIWHGLLGLPRGEDGWREFSGRALLGEIGRQHGKSDREWLEAGVARLSATTVEVRSAGGKVTYGGSLVDEFVRSEEREGWWRVRLNRRLADLFTSAAWSLLDQSVRAQLARKPLAQWLHAFYASHTNPFPYSVSKLMELSGAGKGELWRFRDLLRPALQELENLTGWRCALDREKDMVTIRKSASSKLKEEKEDGVLDDSGEPKPQSDPRPVRQQADEGYRPTSQNEIEEDRLGIVYKPGNTRDQRILAEIYESFEDEAILEVVEFLKLDPYAGMPILDLDTRRTKYLPSNKGFAWAAAVMEELDKRMMDEMPSGEEMAALSERVKQQREEMARAQCVEVAASMGIKLS